MSTPEGTPSLVCDHQSACAVCVTCNICYPHEPGWWEASRIAGPCRDACILRELDGFEILEKVTQGIVDQTQQARARREAERLKRCIQADRDRMLGLDELG
ncbi:MAG TPA: hypothetical protein VGG16_16890 [Streptosporangiaceae bacterium]